MALRVRSAIQAELDKRRSIEETRADLARRHDEIRQNCEHFSGFIRESWRILEPTAVYLPSWHHDAIGEHLEAVNRGEIQRLQINQPPGTMKSMTVSVMLTAWEWGPANCPGLRYLTTSYREDWARRDSRRSRDLIQSEWFQTLWPNITLTRENETDFENTFLGGRKAVPFKSLTAGRGNRVVIDDPHSTEQAESDADREVAARVFRESVTSRLNDPVRDTIIVMMHRLHPDDVCGVIEQIGAPYVKLILPMEYVRSLSVRTPWFTDPRSEEGELLCPNRIPLETNEGQKIELGEHAYATQFQQLPQAREGAYYFKPEHFLIKQPDPETGAEVLVPAPWPTICSYVYGVLDTATKMGKGRDGQGITFFACTQHPTPSLRVLDWEIFELQAAMLEQWLPSALDHGEALARETGAQLGFMGIWIEDRDSGQILLQQAANRGYQCEAISSDLTARGKDGRALSVSGYIYRGLVKYTERAYRKTMPYKGKNKNHSWSQAVEFRIGHGTPTDQDELFDCLCYGTAIALGDVEGH
jgi:hypothetical protein